MFDLSNLMEPKLRIAIVANANSIHTIRWVSWLEKKGHIVTVFSLKEGEKCTYFGPEPRLDRSLIIDLGNDVRKTTRKLQTLIDEVKPDLIHGFFLTNHAFYAGRMENYPIVVTAMGSDVLVHPKESRLLSWVIKKTGNNSMKVICPPLLSKDLVKLGVDENKIVTNLIGINTDIFKPLEKEKCVVFSRGFKDIYNPKVVAKAIILVHKRDPEIKFYLAGDGPLKQTIAAHTATFPSTLSLEAHRNFIDSRIASGIAILPKTLEKENSTNSEFSYKITTAGIPAGSLFTLSNQSVFGYGFFYGSTLMLVLLNLVC